MTTNYPPIDDRILQPRRLGLSDEIAEGVAGTLEHSARFGMIRSSFKLTDTLVLVSQGSAAAKAGGAAIFTFPAVKIVPVAARIVGRLNLSAATATGTAGEIGLGSVVASGAVAVLGGTATFENILEGGVPALGNIAAGATIVAKTYDDFRAHLPTTANTFGGQLFVNAATTFAVAAADLRLLAGSEIDLWWFALEP